MRGLKGKNVLVTGGASGIGQATAARFLKEECDVCVLDSSAEARARVSGELPELGAVIDADVTRLEQVEAARGEIDVLVSDIVMPGITGTELARRLRGSFPRLRVLLMSGYPEPVLATRDALPQEFPVLAKPFSNESLVSLVRTLVEG